MNLYAQNQLSEPIGLLLALAIGALFGFWLERAGFGSSRRLTDIFYFRDFAVLKVMFSAMVTAALGLQLLAWSGQIDLSSLFVPETVLARQLVGGLIFGAGFVMGGWCPGTAAVGVASGKLDALVFLFGAGSGSLAFAGIEPKLGAFLARGARGSCSLPAELGLSGIQGVGILLLLALAAFAMATLIERHKLGRQS